MDHRVLIPLPGGRSEIWKRKLFGFYSDDGKTIADRSKTVCCLCYAQVPYSGNTTNLGIHLAKNHSDVYMQVKADLELCSKTAPGSTKVFKNVQGAAIKKEAGEDRKSVGGGGPGSVNNNVGASPFGQPPPPLPRSSVRATQITDSIASFLCQDLHPPGITEGLGFKSLLNTVEPRYELLPSSEYNEILLAKKQKILQQLQSRLENLEACALTTDCWCLGASGRQFCTLLASYIDNAWTMQTVALRTLEVCAEHTHANHIWDINRVLADWSLMPRIVYHQLSGAMGLQDGDMSLDNPIITVEVSQMKVIAGVTNDEGSIQLAMKHLGMTSIPCFALAITSAVSAGIDPIQAPSVAELIAKARRLASHFARTPKDKELLNKKQEELGRVSPGAGVEQSSQLIVDSIVDTPGKWTTTADMITRLLQLREPLNALLMHHRERSVRELGLTPEEWYQLEILHGALRAVSIAVSILGGEESASASMVAPLLHRMRDKFMKISEADTPAVYQYKKVVWDHLAPRYSEPDVQQLLNISAFLDPRFKDLPHLLDQQKNDVFQTVRQMAVDLDNTQLLADGSDGMGLGAPPGAKRQRKRMEGLDLIFGNATEKDLLGEGGGGSDMDRYMQEPVMDIKDSATHWWRNNEHRFRTLSKLAKRYLSIPATAMSSDRVLSPDGSTAPNRRQCLAAEDTDTMIFLHQNWQLCQS